MKLYVFFVNKILIIGEKSDLGGLGRSKQASKLKHPLWVAPYIKYDLRLYTIIKKKILLLCNRKGIIGGLVGGRGESRNKHKFSSKKNRFWPVCPSLQCDAAKIPWDKRWNPNNMPITIISTKHVSQISKVGSKLLRWEEDIMID